MAERRETGKRKLVPSCIRKTCLAMHALVAIIRACAFEPKLICAYTSGAVIEGQAESKFRGK